MYPGGQSPAQRQDRAHRNVQATRNYLLYVESSKCKPENDDDYNDDSSYCQPVEKKPPTSGQQQPRHHNGEIDLESVSLPFSFNTSGGLSPLVAPSSPVEKCDNDNDVKGCGVGPDTTASVVDGSVDVSGGMAGAAAAAASSSSPLALSSSATIPARQQQQRIPKNSKLTTSASLKPKVNILTADETSLFQRKEQVTIMHELGKSRVLRYEEAVLSGEDDLDGDVGIASDDDDDDISTSSSTSTTSTSSNSIAASSVASFEVGGNNNNNGVDPPSLMMQKALKRRQRRRRNRRDGQPKDVIKSANKKAWKWAKKARTIEALFGDSAFSNTTTTNTTKNGEDANNMIADNHGGFTFDEDEDGDDVDPPSAWLLGDEIDSARRILAKRLTFHNMFMKTSVLVRDHPDPKVRRMHVRLIKGQYARAAMLEDPTLLLAKAHFTKATLALANMDSVTKSAYTTRARLGTLDQEPPEAPPTPHPFDGFRDRYFDHPLYSLGTELRGLDTSLGLHRREVGSLRSILTYIGDRTTLSAEMGNVDYDFSLSASMGRNQQQPPKSPTIAMTASASPPSWGGGRGASAASIASVSPLHNNNNTNQHMNTNHGASTSQSLTEMSHSQGGGFGGVASSSSQHHSTAPVYAPESIHFNQTVSQQVLTRLVQNSAPALSSGGGGLHYAASTVSLGGVGASSMKSAAGGGGFMPPSWGGGARGSRSTSPAAAAASVGGLFPGGFKSSMSLSPHSHANARGDGRGSISFTADALGGGMMGASSQNQGQPPSKPRNIIEILTGNLQGCAPGSYDGVMKALSRLDQSVTEALLLQIQLNTPNDESMIMLQDSSAAGARSGYQSFRQSSIFDGNSAGMGGGQQDGGAGNPPNKVPRMAPVSIAYRPSLTPSVQLLAALPALYALSQSLTVSERASQRLFGGGGSRSRRNEGNGGSGANTIPKSNVSRTTSSTTTSITKKPLQGQRTTRESSLTQLHCDGPEFTAYIIPSYSNPLHPEYDDESSSDGDRDGGRRGQHGGSGGPKKGGARDSIVREIYRQQCLNNNNNNDNCGAPLTYGSLWDSLNVYREALLLDCARYSNQRAIQRTYRLFCKLSERGEMSSLWIVRRIIAWVRRSRLAVFRLVLLRCRLLVASQRDIPTSLSADTTLKSAMSKLLLTSTTTSSQGRVRAGGGGAGDGVGAGMSYSESASSLASSTAATPRSGAVTTTITSTTVPPFSSASRFPQLVGNTGDMSSMSLGPLEMLGASIATQWAAITQLLLPAPLAPGTAPPTHLSESGTTITTIPTNATGQPDGHRRQQPETYPTQKRVGTLVFGEDDTIPLALLPQRAVQETREWMLGFGEKCNIAHRGLQRRHDTKKQQQHSVDTTTSSSKKSKGKLSSTHKKAKKDKTTDVVIGITVDGGEDSSSSTSSNTNDDEDGSDDPIIVPVESTATTPGRTPTLLSPKHAPSSPSTTSKGLLATSSLITPQPSTSPPTAVRTRPPPKDTQTLAFEAAVMPVVLTIPQSPSSAKGVHDGAEEDNNTARRLVGRMFETTLLEINSSLSDWKDKVAANQGTATAGIVGGGGGHATVDGGVSNPLSYSNHPGGGGSTSRGPGGKSLMDTVVGGGSMTSASTVFGVASTVIPRKQRKNSNNSLGKGFVEEGASIGFTRVTEQTAEEKAKVNPTGGAIDETIGTLQKFLLRYVILMQKEYLSKGVDQIVVGKRLERAAERQRQRDIEKMRADDAAAGVADLPRSSDAEDDDDADSLASTSNNSVGTRGGIIPMTTSAIPPHSSSAGRLGSEMSSGAGGAAGVATNQEPVSSAALARTTTLAKQLGTAAKDDRNGSFLGFMSVRQLLADTFLKTVSHPTNDSIHSSSTTTTSTSIGRRNSNGGVSPPRRNSNNTDTTTTSPSKRGGVSSVGATYEEEGATRQQLNSFGDVIDGLLSSLDDQVISELQAKIGLSESSYQQQPSSTNNNNTTAKRGKGTTIKASSGGAVGKLKRDQQDRRHPDISFPSPWVGKLLGFTRTMTLHPTLRLSIHFQSIASLRFSESTQLTMLHNNPLSSKTTQMKLLFDTVSELRERDLLLEGSSAVLGELDLAFALHRVGGGLLLPPKKTHQQTSQSTIKRSQLPPKPTSTNKKSNGGNEDDDSNSLPVSLCLDPVPTISPSPTAGTSRFGSEYPACAKSVAAGNSYPATPLEGFDDFSLQALYQREKALTDPLVSAEILRWFDHVAAAVSASPQPASPTTKPKTDVKKRTGRGAKKATTTTAAARGGVSDGNTSSLKLKPNRTSLGSLDRSNNTSREHTPHNNTTRQSQQQHHRGSTSFNLGDGLDRSKNPSSSVFEDDDAKDGSTSADHSSSNLLPSFQTNDLPPTGPGTPPLHSQQGRTSRRKRIAGGNLVGMTSPLNTAIRRQPSAALTVRSSDSGGMGMDPSTSSHHRDPDIVEEEEARNIMAAEVSSMVGVWGVSDDEELSWGSLSDEDNDNPSHWEDGTKGSPNVVIRGDVPNNPSVNDGLGGGSNTPASRRLSIQSYASDAAAAGGGVAAPISLFKVHKGKPPQHPSANNSRRGSNNSPHNHHHVIRNTSMGSMKGVGSRWNSTYGSMMHMATNNKHRGGSSMGNISSALNPSTSTAAILQIRRKYEAIATADAQRMQQRRGDVVVAADGSIIPKSSRILRKRSTFYTVKQMLRRTKKKKSANKKSQAMKDLEEEQHQQHHNDIDRPDAGGPTIPFHHFSSALRCIIDRCARKLLSAILAFLSLAMHPQMDQPPPSSSSTSSSLVTRNPYAKTSFMQRAILVHEAKQRRPSDQFNSGLLDINSSTTTATSKNTSGARNNNNKQQHGGLPTVSDNHVSMRDVLGGWFWLCDNPYTIDEVWGLSHQGGGSGGMGRRSSKLSNTSTHSNNNNNNNNTHTTSPGQSTSLGVYTTSVSGAADGGPHNHSTHLPPRRRSSTSNVEDSTGGLLSFMPLIPPGSNNKSNSNNNNTPVVKILPQHGLLRCLPILECAGWYLPGHIAYTSIPTSSTTPLAKEDAILLAKLFVPNALVAVTPNTLDTTTTTNNNNVYVNRVSSMSQMTSVGSSQSLFTGLRHPANSATSLAPSESPSQQQQPPPPPQQSLLLPYGATCRLLDGTGGIRSDGTPQPDTIDVPRSNFLAAMLHVLDMGMADVKLHCSSNASSVSSSSSSPNRRGGGSDANINTSVCVPHEALDVVSNPSVSNNTVTKGVRLFHSAAESSTVAGNGGSNQSADHDNGRSGHRSVGIDFRTTDGQQAMVYKHILRSVQPQFSLQVFGSPSTQLPLRDHTSTTTTTSSSKSPTMLLPHVDEYHFCTGIDPRALTKDVIQSAMTSVEMSLVPDILDATVESLRRLTRAKFASAKEEYLSYKRHVAIDEQYALMKMQAIQKSNKSGGGPSQTYKPPPPSKPLSSSTVRDINALLAAAPSEVECREVLKWLWETEIKRSNTGHRTSTIVKLAEQSYLSRDVEESVQLSGSMSMLAMSGRIAAGQRLFDDNGTDDLGNSIRDHARRGSSQHLGIGGGDYSSSTNANATTIPFLPPTVKGAFTDALAEVREEESKGAATILSSESSRVSQTATNLRRCRQCSGFTELFCFTHSNRVRKVQSTDAATGEPLYTVIHRPHSKQSQSNDRDENHTKNTFLTSTIQGKTLLAEMAEAEEASERVSIGGIQPGGRSIFPLVIPRMMAVQDEHHFCLDCIPEYLAQYVSEALTTSAKVKVDAIADLKKKELIRRAREDARKRADATYASTTTKMGIINSSGAPPPGLPQFSVHMNDDGGGGGNSLFYDGNDIARSGGGGPALLVSSPMPDAGGGSLSLRSGRMSVEADGGAGGHIPTLTITADRSMSTFMPESSASSIPSSTSALTINQGHTTPKSSSLVIQSARGLSRSGGGGGGSSPLRTGPDGRLSVETSSMRGQRGAGGSSSSSPPQGSLRTPASITAAMYTSDLKMEEAVKAVNAMSNVMAKHVSPLGNANRRHIDGAHTSGAIPLLQLKHVVDDRYAADLTLEDLAMVATRVNAISQVSQSIRQEAIQMAEADNHNTKNNLLHQNSSGSDSGTATRTTSDFHTRKSPKGAASRNANHHNTDSPGTKAGGGEGDAAASSTSCSNSESLGASVGRGGSTSLAASVSMLGKAINKPPPPGSAPSYVSQAERFYGKEPGNTPPSSSSIAHPPPSTTTVGGSGGISATLNMMEMVRERQRIAVPQERLIQRETEFRSDLFMDERGAFLQIRMMHTAAIEAELGRIRAVVLEEQRRADMEAAAIRQQSKRKAKQALAAGAASSMSNSMSLSPASHGLPSPHSNKRQQHHANQQSPTHGVVSTTVSDKHKPKVMSALSSTPIEVDDGHVGDPSTTSYLDHLAGFSSVSSTNRLFQISRPGGSGGGGTEGGGSHTPRGGNSSRYNQSESLAGIPSPAAGASLMSFDSDDIDGFNDNAAALGGSNASVTNPDWTTMLEGEGASEHVLSTHRSIAAIDSQSREVEMELTKIANSISAQDDDDNEDEDIATRKAMLLKRQSALQEKRNALLLDTHNGMQKQPSFNDSFLVTPPLRATDTTVVFGSAVFNDSDNDVDVDGVRDDGVPKELLTSGFPADASLTTIAPDESPMMHSIRSSALGDSFTTQPGEMMTLATPTNNDQHLSNNAKRKVERDKRILARETQKQQEQEARHHAREAAHADAVAAKLRALAGGGSVSSGEGPGSLSSSYLLCHPPPLTAANLDGITITGGRDASSSRQRGGGGSSNVSSMDDGGGPPRGPPSEGSTNVFDGTNDVGNLHEFDAFHDEDDADANFTRFLTGGVDNLANSFSGGSSSRRVSHHHRGSVANNSMSGVLGDSLSSPDDAPLGNDFLMDGGASVASPAKELFAALENDQAGRGGRGDERSHRQLISKLATAVAASAASTVSPAAQALVLTNDAETSMARRAAIKNLKSLKSKIMDAEKKRKSKSSKAKAGGLIIKTAGTKLSRKKSERLTPRHTSIDHSSGTPNQPYVLTTLNLILPTFMSGRSGGGQNQLDGSYSAAPTIPPLPIPATLISSSSRTPEKSGDIGEEGEDVTATDRGGGDSGGAGGLSPTTKSKLLGSSSPSPSLLPPPPTLSSSHTPAELSDVVIKVYSRAVSKVADSSNVPPPISSTVNDVGSYSSNCCCRVDMGPCNCYKSMVGSAAVIATIGGVSCIPVPPDFTTPLLISILLDTTAAFASSSCAATYNTRHTASVVSAAVKVNSALLMMLHGLYRQSAALPAEALRAMMSVSGLSTILHAGQGSATSKSIEARWVRTHQQHNGERPRHRQQQGNPTDLIVERLLRVGDNNIKRTLSSSSSQQQQSLLLLTTSLVAARLPIATTHELSHLASSGLTELSSSTSFSQSSSPQSMKLSETLSGLSARGQDGTLALPKMLRGVHILIRESWGPCVPYIKRNAQRVLSGLYNPIIDDLTSSEDEEDEDAAPPSSPLPTATPRDAIPGDPSNSHQSRSKLELSKYEQNRVLTGLKGFWHARCVLLSVFELFETQRIGCPHFGGNVMQSLRFTVTPWRPTPTTNPIISINSIPQPQSGTSQERQSSKTQQQQPQQHQLPTTSLVHTIHVSAKEELRDRLMRLATIQHQRAVTRINQSGVASAPESTPSIPLLIQRILLRLLLWEQRSTLQAVFAEDITAPLRVATTTSATPIVTQDTPTTTTTTTTPPPTHRTPRAASATLSKTFMSAKQSVLREDLKMEEDDQLDYAQHMIPLRRSFMAYRQSQDTLLHTEATNIAHSVVSETLLGGGGSDTTVVDAAPSSSNKTSTPNNHNNINNNTAAHITLRNRLRWGVHRLVSPDELIWWSQACTLGVLQAHRGRYPQLCTRSQLLPTYSSPTSNTTTTSSPTAPPPPQHQSTNATNQQQQQRQQYDATEVAFHKEAVEYLSSIGRVACAMSVLGQVRESRALLHMGSYPTEGISNSLPLLSWAPWFKASDFANHNVELTQLKNNIIENSLLSSTSLFDGMEVVARGGKRKAPRGGQQDVHPQQQQQPPAAGQPPSVMGFLTGTVARASLSTSWAERWLMSQESATTHNKLPSTLTTSTVLSTSSATDPASSVSHSPRTRVHHQQTPYAQGNTQSCINEIIKALVLEDCVRIKLESQQYQHLPPPQKSSDSPSIQQTSSQSGEARDTGKSDVVFARKDFVSRCHIHTLFVGCQVATTSSSSSVPLDDITPLSPKPVERKRAPSTTTNMDTTHHHQRIDVPILEILRSNTVGIYRSLFSEEDVFPHQHQPSTIISSTASSPRSPPHPGSPREASSCSPTTTTTSAKIDPHTVLAGIQLLLLLFGHPLSSRQVPDHAGVTLAEGVCPMETDARSSTSSTSSSPSQRGHHTPLPSQHFCTTSQESAIYRRNTMSLRVVANTIFTLCEQGPAQHSNSSDNNNIQMGLSPALIGSFCLQGLKYLHRNLESNHKNFLAQVVSETTATTEATMSSSRRRSRSQSISRQRSQSFSQHQHHPDGLNDDVDGSLRDSDQYTHHQHLPIRIYRPKSVFASPSPLLSLIPLPTLESIWGSMGSSTITHLYMNEIMGGHELSLSHIRRREHYRTVMRRERYGRMWKQLSLRSVPPPSLSVDDTTNSINNTPGAISSCPTGLHDTLSSLEKIFEEASASSSQQQQKSTSSVNNNTTSSSSTLTELMELIEGIVSNPANAGPLQRYKGGDPTPLPDALVEADNGDDSDTPEVVILNAQASSTSSPLPTTTDLATNNPTMSVSGGAAAVHGPVRVIPPRRTLPISSSTFGESTTWLLTALGETQHESGMSPNRSKSLVVDKDGSTTDTPPPQHQQGHGHDDVDAQAGHASLHSIARSGGEKGAGSSVRRPAVGGLDMAVKVCDMDATTILPHSATPSNKNSICRNAPSSSPARQLPSSLSPVVSPLFGAASSSSSSAMVGGTTTSSSHHHTSSGPNNISNRARYGLPRLAALSAPPTIPPPSNVCDNRKAGKEVLLKGIGRGLLPHTRDRERRAKTLKRLVEAEEREDHEADALARAHQSTIHTSSFGGRTPDTVLQSKIARLLQSRWTSESTGAAVKMIQRVSGEDVLTISSRLTPIVNTSPSSLSGGGGAKGGSSSSPMKERDEMIDARGGVVKKQEIVASPDEKRLQSLAEGSRQPRPRAITEVICVTTARNNNNATVTNANAFDGDSINFVSPIRSSGRPSGVAINTTPTTNTTSVPSSLGGAGAGGAMPSSSSPTGPNIPPASSSSIQSIEEVRRGLPASPAVTESLNVLNEAKRELLRAQLREGLAYKPKR